MSYFDKSFAKHGSKADYLSWLFNKMEALQASPFFGVATKEHESTDRRYWRYMRLEIRSQSAKEFEPDLS